MGNKPTLDGQEVSGVAFEFGSGGAPKETAVVIGDGDEGFARVRWRCVNVKHPFKAGEVSRLQTLNILDGEIEARSITKFVPEPKVEQPELPNGEKTS
jgi:hypothetical protein